MVITAPFVLKPSVVHFSCLCLYKAGPSVVVVVCLTFQILTLQKVLAFLCSRGFWVLPCAWLPSPLPLRTGAPSLVSFPAHQDFDERCLPVAFFGGLLMFLCFIFIKIGTQMSRNNEGRKVKKKKRPSEVVGVWWQTWLLETSCFHFKGIL